MADRHIVKDDPKAPFSIGTTLRCRGGHYSFPWIAPLTLDSSYFIMLSIKQEGIKYHFLRLWYDSTYYAIWIMVRVFANGLGDWVSIPGQVIPKTKKLVLDALKLNTQHNKVDQGQVEQSRERSNALPYISVL